MANADRNTNIDLYRIVLMLGICLLHCVHQGIYQCRPLTMSLLFCVDGFVFISGWCGIRFSWGKVLRLHGVAAYAAIVCALYSMAGGNCSTGAFLQTAFSLWKGFWFLHAYVLLMLVSPCINAAFELLSEGKLLSVALPLLAIPFCWSFAHDVPLLRRFVPDTEGLSAYSGLTFVGVYVAGRLARRFESRIVILLSQLQNRLLWFTQSPRSSQSGYASKISRSLRTWREIFSMAQLPLWIAILALTGICALGFGRYHSPFAMLLAACWFFMFKFAPPPPIVASHCCIYDPICVFHISVSFARRGWISSHSADSGIFVTNDGGERF